MQEAGPGESTFHSVFTVLQNDPANDAAAAIAIAHAYTGERYTTREMAMGGIETEFYAQRAVLTRNEQGHSRGGP